jgi:hypothetical protein
MPNLQTTPCVIIVRLRRLLIPLVVGIVLPGFTSAAASAVTPEKGAVSGKAVPCAGPFRVPTARLGVFKGTTMVASGRFRSGSTFHIALAPGRYTITNDPVSPNGTSFRVRADRVTHVVIVNACD